MSNLPGAFQSFVRLLSCRSPRLYEGGGRLAKVLTGAVIGLDGALAEIAVDIAQSGLPNFLIVGLPDAAVQKERERVRAASRNSGLSFPKRRRYLCCG